MDTNIPQRLNGAPPRLTDVEVLDTYGRRGSTQETIRPPVGGDEIIRASAEAMIANTMSALVAAEAILKMLREEAETFTSEVRRHSNNLAARMATYVDCCKAAADAMAQHRESVLQVAATIADEPSTISENHRDRE